MADPTTGTTADTYAEAYVEVESTLTTTTTPIVTTQSEAIATYFIDDLRQFINDLRIDLLKYLEFPPEEARNTEEVLELLFDDLAHMLRDRLITGIHILLSDNVLDPNLHAYPLFYHAEYLVQIHERIFGAPENPEAVREGGGLKLLEAWRTAKFAMLIDWSPSATKQRRERVNRASGYCFDWVPEHARYDASSLLKFGEGGLTMAGVTLVDRSDYTVPGAQRP